MILLIYIFLVSFLYSEGIEENLKRSVYIYLSNDKYKEAEELCCEFLKRYPDNCTGYELLNKVYVQWNNIVKAIKINKDGLENNPGCYVLYYNLIENYYRLGKYEEAEKYIVKLESLGTNFQKIDFKNFLKLSGKTYFFLKDYYKAVKYFEKYINYKYDDEEVYDTIVISHKKIYNENLATAYSEMKKLLNTQYAKDEKLFRFYSGIIFLKYGEYLKSLENFNSIYDYMQNNIELNFNIGLANLLLNNPVEAEAYFIKAFSLHNKKSKIKKFIRSVLKNDKKGGKYALVLALTYYLNAEYNLAKEYYSKVKNYDKKIYNYFKFDDIINKSSKLYKELPLMYEVP